MNSKKKKDFKNCTICKESKKIEEFIKKCGRCKPCRSAHNKEYRLQNIEKFKEKDKKYHEKNKEKVRERNNNYYENNKEQIKIQRKEFREDNKEYLKEKNHNYYMSNIQKRLGITYRNRVRSKLKSGKGYIDFLGCSIEKLMKWFEFNFSYEDNFNWDNYGKVWEIDHVIPCAQFDLTIQENVDKCFNWKNTKPVKKNYNRKKNKNIVATQVLEHEIRLKIYGKML